MYNDEMRTTNADTGILPVMSSPRQQQNLGTRRQVALLVHTANDWTRQILRGVAAFAHDRGHWDFHIEPRGLYERLVLPRGWTGDGVILRLAHPGIRQAIRSIGIPAVNVSWLGTHSIDIPKVVSDEAACGRLGAEHLLETGFRCFGFVGPRRELGYSDLLLSDYSRRLSQANFVCHTAPRIGSDEGDAPSERRTQLTNWLRTLSRPVGILVWDTESGRELTEICRWLNLRVPHEVAVLCVEHDPLMSSLAPTPLSNINQAPFQVGFKAGELLDRMMNGEAAPHKPVLVPPLGIVHRQSTDTSSVDDTLVGSAVTYIRNHVHEPIQVIDLQKEFGVSRRMLERRFLKALGRTPAVEIRRRRIERVKRALIETDLPLAEIADQCGFNHPEVLMRTFKRTTGMSAGKFRRSH